MRMPASPAVNKTDTSLVPRPHPWGWGLGTRLTFVHSARATASARSPHATLARWLVMVGFPLQQVNSARLKKPSSSYRVSLLTLALMLAVLVFPWLLRAAAQVKIKRAQAVTLCLLRLRELNQAQVAVLEKVRQSLILNNYYYEPQGWPLVICACALTQLLYCHFNGLCG